MYYLKEMVKDNSCMIAKLISLYERDEFSRATISENQKNLIINLRGRVPMKIEDIDFGIQLGQAIIQSKKYCHLENRPTEIKKEDDFEL